MLRLTVLAVTACAWLALAPVAQAGAKSKKEPGTTHPTTKKRAVKVNNSVEAAAERKRRLAAAREERRLTRECRGMPNAGACLGYARQ
ncbi:MAG: hypothetical protein BGO13_01850 [Burkholderiales bacterium 66-5]|uniref:hypothetical protein n=1 Tax=Comamonas badia TaxID=265291 RepID=UPI00046405C6|nr:hypothetical protein [Comamonas badia]OJU91765.1 MAG: hypothetical protein BGO13_01850 [Burkholderiales bacterium 66-5]